VAEFEIRLEGWEDNVSLYNALFGLNSDALALLEAVGLKPEGIPRFRDAYYAGNREVAVYTRCGGGNRECWESDRAEEKTPKECGCPGCWITSIILKHPLYVRDEDDNFDCTYATVYFRLPNSVPDALWPEDEDRNTRWLTFLATLRGKTS